MKKTFLLVVALIGAHAQPSVLAQKNLSLLWTSGWSSDGKYIAVGGDNGTLTVLIAKDLSVYKTFPFDSMTIPVVAWHPTLNLLAFSAYPHNRKLNTSTLQILNIETGESIKVGKYGGRGLCWSPDGSKLALGGTGIISIFSREGKKIRDIPHSSGRSLFSVSWHPTKNIIAAADEDVRLFDIETGNELLAVKVAEIPKAILCVRWHPSGKFFATGDYGHEGETEPSFLKFFTENGMHMRTMTGSKSAYRGMKWNADGTKLATVSDSLRVWSSEGRLLLSTNKSAQDLWGIDWHGNKITTAGRQSGVLIWNEYGKLLIERDN